MLRNLARSRYDLSVPPRRSLELINWAHPGLPAEMFESLAADLLDLYDGALQADWSVSASEPLVNLIADLNRSPSSASESLPIQSREADETFDLQLLTSFERDFLPTLASPTTPDGLISRTGELLGQASAFYRFESGRGNCVHRWFAVGEECVAGSTEDLVPLPRERFRRWCFDLLFAMCQISESGVLLSVSVPCLYWSLTGILPQMSTRVEGSPFSPLRRS